MIVTVWTLNSLVEIKVDYFRLQGKRCNTKQVRWENHVVQTRMQRSNKFAVICQHFVLIFKKIEEPWAHAHAWDFHIIIPHGIIVNSSPV